MKFNFTYGKNIEIIHILWKIEGAEFVYGLVNKCVIKRK